MVEAKQVKVDNWGIFFLQRLQQFYDKAVFCDLTLQFDDNVQIKVHRLVMNACTEYFQILENTCIIEKDTIMMPTNLPSDVVIPIINFMYSGILEFHDTLFDRLYSTAKLMNMSVLTKLLDAQKNPIQPVKPITKKVQSVTPITWNLQGKKITTKNVIDSDLPETLPGRKLPIWKRKSAPITHPYIPTGLGFEALNSKPYVKPNVDETPKPTRFEWPDEDTTFENSFDEISYTSKPIILPTLSREAKPSTSNSTFDEIKRSGSTKRSASPIGNQCKKVNIQDVKEYLKEHKIRSDYIDYDDSETTDNDLQTYDNTDDHDSNEEGSKDGADIFTNQQPLDETPSKGILKTDKSESSPNKHVRFSLDGKENTTNKPTIKVQTPTAATPDVSNHTKIITEVLKKYPHLVKKNKNIRLKILAKGANPANTPGKVITAATSSKAPSKIQYMVMKSDSKTATSSSDKKINEQEQGPWVCKKCEHLTEFTSYHAYRQHLTESHNEKGDSQMCNICGQICRKQNMLIYHKYIKHNITPPSPYNFPKCKECPYIALSPALLNKHVQQHCPRTNQQSQSNENKILPQWGCQYCDKAFFSENILLAHQKRNHEMELKQDDNKNSKELTTNKEKIKILSDIKVNTGLPAGTTLIPVRQIGDIRKPENVSDVPEPLEPSSEAEALSNVASGIAASLGLVDTIVVLDENQFILQSAQGNLPQNVINNSGSDYILPEMQMSDLTSIATTSIDPNQPPVVTLSSDTNTVLTQSLNKSEIATTDELVMVLTDHDYSDAANQAVISGDNNIVVLYSHPVQTQATMMINSETGMLEVDKNYHEAAEISNEQQTEESIEMIQQEINNHLETDMIHHQQQQQQQQQHHQEYRQESIITDDQENTYRVCSESVARILQENQHLQQAQLQSDTIIINNDQPVVEESIQMIQEEINNIPQETQNINTLHTTVQTEINEEMYQTVEVDHNLQNQQQNVMEESEMAQETSQVQIENQKLNPDANIEENNTAETVPQEYEDKKDGIIATQDYTENVSGIDIQNQYIQEEPQQNERNVTKIESNSDAEVNTESKVNMETEENMETNTNMETDSNMETEENMQTEIKVESDLNMETGVNTSMETEEKMVIQDEAPFVEERIREEPIDKSENQEQFNSQEIKEDETNENASEVTEAQIESQTQTEEIKNTPEENMEIISESSKILDSTDELIENTQKMLETAENVQTENIGTNTEESHEQTEMEIDEMESNQKVVESTQESQNLEQDSEPQQLEPQESQTPELMDTSENQQSEEILHEKQSIGLETVEPEKSDIETVNSTPNDPEVNTSENNEEPSKVPSDDLKSPENDEEEEENIVEAIKSEVKKEISKKAEMKKLTAISSMQAKEKISKILDDWDDADTDSPQSNSKTNNGSSINKLIDDWEDEEDT